MLAAKKGYGDMIELFLAYGADINARDSVDRSALYFAAIQGHSDVVRVLVERGAKVDDTFPFHFLCVNSDTKKFVPVIDALLSSGAHIIPAIRRNLDVHSYQREVAEVIQQHYLRRGSDFT